MRSFFIEYYTGITKKCIRMLHDVIVRNIAEKIASISSEFDNGPPSHWRLEERLADKKPTFPTPQASSAAFSIPPHTSSTSDASGSLSSGVFFTRTPLPQLAREDFPNVKYWDTDGYASRRKHGKGDSHEEVQAKGKASVLSSFMEDENGDPIPESTKSAARKEAKGFFQLLLNMGRAPVKWGSASIDINNKLIYRLESGFPFIRLCDNHWKAAQIATNSYSQWYPTAVKNMATTLANQPTKKPADSQVIDVDAENTNHNEPQKRPRDEDNETRRPKRPRVEETEPAPPPPACPPIVTTQRQRVCKPFQYDYMRH